MNNFYKYNLSISNSQDMIKITSLINESIKNSGIKDGLVTVYCPHTTAGITINENADPDVVKDLLYGFNKTFPIKDNHYRHFEGNSHSHLKSSTVGASQCLILHDGKLILGRWQDIYFCEFDGPRNRTFYVKIIEG